MSIFDVLVNIRRDAMNMGMSREFINRLDAQIASFLDETTELPCDNHPIWQYYCPITNHV